MTISLLQHFVIVSFKIAIQSSTLENINILHFPSYIFSYFLYFPAFKPHTFRLGPFRFMYLADEQRVAHI